LVLAEEQNGGEKATHNDGQRAWRAVPTLAEQTCLPDSCEIEQTSGWLGQIGIIHAVQTQHPFPVLASNIVDNSDLRPLIECVHAFHGFGTHDYSHIAHAAHYASC
jgi:hypothetical protein